MYLAISGEIISPDSDSADRRSTILDDLCRFLCVAVVAYIIIFLFCVLEFTIGIKRVINYLYRGKI
jgi:hypothetical protein